MKLIKDLLESSRFSSADVVSKLNDAAKSKKNHDLVGFALENDKGEIIKVKIPADQADAFEQQLGAALYASSEDYSDSFSDLPKTSNVEIAEVLFNLRHRFDIIDVEWPDILGDEENEDTVDDAEMDMDADDVEMDMDADDAEMDMDADDAEMDDGQSSMQSTLQQILDMLKAEAVAKEAEAKAKEAEYAMKTAELKLKKEEEILDMEAYYTAKKEEKKEADQLKKLARYKHEIANESKLLSFGEFTKIIGKRGSI